jgi:DNA-directed RNA polymerase specialized sigma24 family protein
MVRDDHTPDCLSRTEARAALDQMGEADWIRAERLASVAARGLPGMSPEDLLQEACTKLLSGQRRFPRDTHPLVVLKTAMRSEANNARKSSRASPIDDAYQVGVTLDSENSPQPVEGSDRRTPEVERVAKEQIDALLELVSDDPNAELVMMAWFDNLRGQHAIEATGLTAKDYDSARKRLMRKLATFAPPLGET